MLRTWVWQGQLADAHGESQFVIHVEVCMSARLSPGSFEELSMRKEGLCAIGCLLL
jgi:hypothetical protein